jgi:hypothetical protein
MKAKSFSRRELLSIISSAAALVALPKVALAAVSKAEKQSSSKPTTREEFLAKNQNLVILDDQCLCGTCLKSVDGVIISDEELERLSIEFSALNP